MGKKVKPLSVAAIKAAPIGRRLADGLGLYIEIRPSTVGAYAYALFRYSAPGGKRREAGIGVLNTGTTASRGGISLAAIRGQAHELHRLIRDGRDPIAELQVERQQKHAAVLAVREIPTFQEALHRYVEKESPGWTSARYAAGWAKAVEDHAAGLLPLRVGDITPQMVAEALKATWQDKPVSASKVRARIEAIFSYAIAQEWRASLNPATLAMIRDLMPAVEARKTEVKHFAAARWQEIGEIMQALAKVNSVGSLAAQFAILTAARAEEVRGVVWSEIDMSPLRAVVLVDDDGGRYTEITGASWDVPKERMKARRPHRLPLAPEALAILATVKMLHPKPAATDLVFPGRGGRAPMGIEGQREALAAAGYGHLSMHGMRSTFRSWAGEATSFDTTLAEFSLAHIVHGATERAYARGSLFEKRRALMDAWGKFCTRPLRESAAGDVVVELRPAVAG